MNTKILNLEFTLQEMQIIAQSLQELPYKTVAGLLQKIDHQVQPQLVPEQPKPEQPKEE